MEKKFFKKIEGHTGLLILAVFLILCLSVVSTGNVLAQAEVEIKLAFDETEDLFDTPSGPMVVFKNYIERESNGEIKLKVYPCGQLGNASERLLQVKRGTIQASTSIPSGQLAAQYYPDLSVFDIPFLFSSNIVAYKIVHPENKFAQDLYDDIARKTGIRVLAFFVAGKRHFTNNVRPIKRPEDFKGLKIRTMQVPAHMKMVEAFGGSPTPISYNELYTALQTGVVDGQENNIQNIRYTNIFETQKYITLDGHITLFNVLIINEKFYQSLSERHRNIIKEAALQAIISFRGLVELLEINDTRYLIEKGMQFTHLSSAELDRFKKVAQPPVIEYIKQQLDTPTMIEHLLDEIRRVEEELGRPF